ncbi:MAG: hypothetical protein HXY19_02370 [Thermoanaerobaculaceae bacterium]|jgi:hypothetical protein|nr:hypothetical protein [Thermoanaerobaculaceae bacterium]
MRYALTVALAVTLVAGTVSGRELTWVYVVPAAANTTGLNGTDWHTDLTLYNPHTTTLPVVLQFLPSGRDNRSGVPTVELELAPWETLNLWDVLGPHGFAARGKTGALLVYADDDRVSCSGSSCDFAVFSRTYTLNPSGGSGEFGQGIAGFPASLGLDRSVIAYLPQLTDDSSFRTNLGVASWTAAAVTVRVELQDRSGHILDRRDHVVPPYGHIQWRVEHGVAGGTAAVYIVAGPDDAMVYPYASVVNWVTGDPAYVEAHLTTVGLTAQTALGRSPRQRPPALPVPTFSRALLAQNR